MNRLAALLLLVGGVLLISWAVAPAAPVTMPRAAATPAPPIAQVVQELNTDVNRLRDRLGAVPKYPAPKRNPFRYDRRPDAEPASLTVESTSPAELPAPALPMLPKLLAILVDTVDGARSYRAVLAVGTEISVVKAGDAAGPLRVRAVTADSAELVDPASQQIFRIVLQ